jgi:glycosyltransferase involved in cell wall biosynthesis
MEETLEKGGINDYELVLVGNYVPSSGDTTPTVIEDLARSDARIRTVIEQKYPQEKKGMGYDMHAGLRAATGNIIAVIDGDGQMPPEDVVRVFNELRSKNLDLCKTKRIARHDGWWRVTISMIFNTIMRGLFPGVHAPDINGKPKIMRREAFQKMNLRSQDWFIDAEIMLEARTHKLRVGDVPTIFYANKERPSFISFRAIFEFIANIIHYRIKTLW